MQRIEEYNNTTGTLLRRYVYGVSLDECLYTIDASTSTVAYLHGDETGSTILTTDSTGMPTQRNVYKPYGQLSSGSLSDIRIGYTGQFFEVETGLYFYKARHYSPKLGRFLQPDPIGYEGGLNLYEYAGSDPINLCDPSGLILEDLIKAGGTFLKGGVSVAVNLGGVGAVPTIPAAVGHGLLIGTGIGLGAYAAGLSLLPLFAFSGGAALAYWSLFGQAAQAAPAAGAPSTSPPPPPPPPQHLNQSVAERLALQYTESHQSTLAEINLRHDEILLSSLPFIVPIPKALLGLPVLGPASKVTTLGSIAVRSLSKALGDGVFLGKGIPTPTLRVPNAVARTVSVLGARLSVPLGLTQFASNEIARAIELGAENAAYRSSMAKLKP